MGTTSLAGAVLSEKPSQKSATSNEVESFLLLRKEAADFPSAFLSFFLRQPHLFTILWRSKKESKYLCSCRPSSHSEALK